MVPDTTGVSAIGSPITAGKGACRPWLQATSAHKVMNTPVSRIDLTRAELEPGSEPGSLFVNGARFHI